MSPSPSAGKRFRRLPVIVSFGGINAAGRASCHHAYRRMVYTALGSSQREATLAALGSLMGVEHGVAKERHILNHTLIRRIEEQHFDVDAVPWNQRLPVHGEQRPLTFEIETRYLPDRLPANWTIRGTSVTHSSVQVRGSQDLLVPTSRDFEVKSAAQLPTGFEPGRLYPSRNHPRGLQMTIYAASDALGNLGIDWQTVVDRVGLDGISVYAGSAMGQLDDAGAGGMLKARSNGQRVSSKFCPLGFAEMPADFINAYVLGGVGATGASLGACASFLYNLRHGIEDIRSGRSRVAFIAGAEAPVTPEIMEGYSAMGALATVKNLRKLDGLVDAQEPDYRRACRPFGENCGFTMGESAQALMLFDDELALELGATVFGAATDVFVNADGHKKSISSPGVGNYITMARALSSVRSIVGEEGVRRGGIVQAHGTGTPQNRVSEAAILSDTAGAFGIEDWPIAAIKSLVGHSLGCASGDQINTTLGIWQNGLIPGIGSIDAVAQDVSTDHLAFSLKHCEIDTEVQQYAIVNSKGFGGNNASAALMAPAATERMLRARHGDRAMLRWRRVGEEVAERRARFDEANTAGEHRPVYHFDHNVIQAEDVSVDADALQVGPHRLALSVDETYADMKLG